MQTGPGWARPGFNQPGVDSNTRTRRNCTPCKLIVVWKALLERQCRHLEVHHQVVYEPVCERSTPSPESLGDPFVPAKRASEAR